MSNLNKFFQLQSLCIIAALFSLMSCAATAPKMNRLSTGMTKQDVIKVMGTPVSTAAPGGGEEILRYELSANSTAAYYGITQEYFVRLLNGVVHSYGRMGDFNSLRDPTLNLNIRHQ